MFGERLRMEAFEVPAPATPQDEGGRDSASGIFQ
jgi:hypothetical protein